MEPERRIEKWLRAFAKKRREQAGDPMELHPVARQQLQKEIARRAAGTSGGGGWFSNLFIGLRPKLVFAVCFTGVVIIGLALLPRLTHPKPSTLASANLPRDEMVPMEKTPPPLQPPSVSTVAPPAGGEGTRGFEDKQPAISGTLAMTPAQAEPIGANRQPMVAPAETLKQAEPHQNTIAQFDATADVPVVSIAPSNKETFAFKAEDAPIAGAFGGASALSKDAVSQKASSAPPQTTKLAAMTNGTTLAANEETQKKLKVQTKSVSPATASAAFFDRSKSESDAVIPPVSQVFNRSDILVSRRRTDDTLSSASPVLLSFRMEQTGNAVRVVDADGSVYTGAVELAQQQAGAVRALAPKNAPAVAGRAGTPSSAAQNYFFRVTGTNRNLKQNVVFSGNLIPLTNASFGSYGFGGGGGGAPGAQRAAKPSTELLLSNSRISGTAVIGDQKEIEVIATPAP